MSGVVIAKMTHEHMADICAIEKDCFSHPWTEISYREVLADPNVLALVAVENGKTLGYVSVQTVLDEGYLGNLAVSKDARRRGIAGMLLAALFDVAQAKKLSFLTLEVRDSNLAARALYEKYGFQYVGRRPSFYSSPTEDGLLMTKYFTDNQGGTQ